VIGTTVSVTGENLTGAELARSLTSALGETVRWNDVNPDAFRSFGFPGADEFGNMFHFKRDFEADWAGAHDPQRSRSLNPELLTFDDWLTTNAKRIPLA
jgi:hypothetical protein